MQIKKASRARRLFLWFQGSAGNAALELVFLFIPELIVFIFALVLFPFFTLLLVPIFCYFGFKMAWGE